jgi:hypothetical protein
VQGEVAFTSLVVILAAKSRVAVGTVLPSRTPLASHRSDRQGSCGWWRAAVAWPAKIARRARGGARYAKKCLPLIARAG